MRELELLRLGAGIESRVLFKEHGSAWTQVHVMTGFVV